jgi:hypothetical protein
VRGPERGGDVGCGVGGDLVGRGGGDEDRVERGRVDARVGDGVVAGLGGEV